MRNWKYAAVAIGVITLGPRPVRAEIFNQFVSLPTSSANSFTIVFGGDVVADINTAETALDPSVNPFAYVNQDIVGGGGSDVTATLNGSGNTVVTFTGSNPILPTYNFPNNGKPHFGLDPSSLDGSGAQLNIISESWNYSPGSTALPSISVSNPSSPTGDTFGYVILYATVTSGSTSVGEWFEVPYTGTLPTLTITNYTGMAETLSNVGYVLSPTLIPLDNLNFDALAPPGSPGNTFNVLTQYDGSSLAPGDGNGGAGGSFTTPGLASPEPSSIVSLGTGLLLMAGHVGRRRRGGR